MNFDPEILQEVAAESYVHPGVEMVHIPGKGTGLVTNTFLPKNTVVSISGGLVVNKTKYEELQRKFLFDDYAYFVEENQLIMPLNPKDPSADWRMNHCCEPNCGISGQTVFVAIRDIEPGEELTFDYCMSESDPDYVFPLQCKKGSCRKQFSGNDWRRKDLQKKYAGYFSSYLRRKMDSVE
ncbi:MAG: SET domain-containing protein-lysine N-methyltransferase, partial [Leptospira sp.]|nr:SET domain-containing protein-lysine N-methyltransferase [Leptospira sp.]